MIWIRKINKILKKNLAGPVHASGCGDCHAFGLDAGLLRLRTGKIGTGWALGGHVVSFTQCSVIVALGF